MTTAAAQVARTARLRGHGALARAEVRSPCHSGRRAEIPAHAGRGRDDDRLYQPLGSGCRPGRTAQRYLRLYNLSRRVDVQISRRSKTRLTGTVNLVPTPHQGTPRYRLVAEELRRRIEAGAIPAGALLPPESAIVKEFGISRGTAREAIASLRTEGLVVTEHGRGTYVRLKPTIRRLKAKKYHPSEWYKYDPNEQYRLDVTHDDVPATPYLAQIFQIAIDTKLVRRRTVVRSNGAVQQIFTSYHCPEELAVRYRSDPLNTNTSDHELEGSTGPATNIRDIVRARMPTEEEARTMQIIPGTPLLAVTRHIFAGGTVVEVVQDLIVAADRTELEYDIDISESSTSMRPLE